MGLLALSIRLRTFVAVALLSPLATLAAAQNEVARISLAAPNQTVFTVRATLPVPKGEVLSTLPSVPLSVLNPNGSIAPTQVEVVTRYANPADGADVVEVIARVARPAGVATGDRIDYSVVQNPHPALALERAPQVEALLASPNLVRLTSSDVFGNTYSADLLRDVRSNDVRTFKDGQLIHQVGGHEILTPDENVEGPEAVLPHLMGIKTYVTTYDNDRLMAIDLVIHNGLDGQRDDTAADDVLNDLYFRELNMEVPAGWTIETAFGSPFLQEQVVEGNNTRRTLVSALTDGNMHYMPRQAQFVKRIMLSHGDTQSRGEDVLDERHLAFCRLGFSGTSGAPLWSWWNRETARFFPQRHRLPTLEGQDLAQISLDLRLRLATVQDQFDSGEAGGYPFTSPAMGWAHPWGVAYGGMTGGDEINLFDGLRTVTTGSNRGYKLIQAISKAYLDRQPCALYNIDGIPTTLDDLLVTEGFGAPYLPGSFSLRPSINSSGDWFGFDQAPQDHTRAVSTLDQRPHYQGELNFWNPIDTQHLIRFTRTWKVMTWLGNDAVSKEILEATFQRYRLSYHNYPNGSYGYAQGSGMLRDTNHVLEYPNQGIPIGRSEAWGLDVAVSAFAVGDDAQRQDVEEWVRSVVQMFADGQSECTGNLMAEFIYKPQYDRYLVRQSREVGFLDQALRSISESMYRGLDNQMANMVDDILLGSVSSSIERPFWSDTTPGPYVTVPSGTADLSVAPDLCFDVPNGVHSVDVDLTMYWSSLAYAYRLSEDPIFLQKAAQMSESGNLVEDFLAGMQDVESRAALMALLEELYPND